MSSEQSTSAETEDTLKANYEDKLLALEMALKVRDEEIQNNESEKEQLQAKLKVADQIVSAFRQCQDSGVAREERDDERREKKVEEMRKELIRQSGEVGQLKFDLKELKDENEQIREKCEQKMLVQKTRQEALISKLEV